MTIELKRVAVRFVLAVVLLAAGCSDDGGTEAEDPSDTPATSTVTEPPATVTEPSTTSDTSPAPIVEEAVVTITGPINTGGGIAQTATPTSA